MPKPFVIPPEVLERLQRVIQMVKAEQQQQQQAGRRALKDSDPKPSKQG